MKLCIAGKNDIAVDSVNYLLSNGVVEKGDLLACFNRSDDGNDSFQRSYRKFCADQGIEEATLEALYGLEDLVFVSLEYDRIVPVHRFKSDRLFNIHFSLLPKYKGVYTSAWPILNGDEHSGVTLHCIDEGIDTGAIIDAIRFPVDADDTCRDLYLKYIRYGSELFKKKIECLLNNEYDATKQPAQGASYYSKASIDFLNIQIDLNKTAYEIKNQVRAYCFKEYQTPTIHRVEVKLVDILDSKSCNPAGYIVNDKESFMEMATIDYNVRVYKV